MPITVKGLIATLDYWSLLGVHAKGEKAKSHKRSKSEMLTGERSIVRMLAGDRPTNMLDLASVIRPLALREARRPASLATRKMILGRIATLSAAPETYHEFYAAGQQPKARLAQRHFEKWRRAIVPRQTVKAPAYQKAKHWVGGELPSLEWLSDYNMTRLRDEVGDLDAQELPIFKRITEGELFFKHMTDAATCIQASEGRLMAPVLGIKPSGTTPRNRAFNHLSYVFGRMEFRAGASGSRFGASTIEIPYSALARDITISLHDQNMPFGGVTSPHDMFEGSIIRRITASASQPTHWVQQYGDDVDAPMHNVSFLHEIFHGRDVCREAVALVLVRELRRIAGGSDKGKAFRDRVYAQGAEPSKEPYYFENIMKRMFHIEIRVPIAINLGELKKNQLKVYDPAGSGAYDEEGHPDEKGAAAVETFKALKHGIADPATVYKFVTAIGVFLEEQRVKATSHKGRGADYATDVIRLWSSRLESVRDSLATQGTPQANAARKRLDLLLAGLEKAVGKRPAKSLFSIERARDLSTEFAEGTPRERIEIILDAARDLLDKQIKMSIIEDCNKLMTLLRENPPDAAAQCDAIHTKRHRRMSSQHTPEQVLLANVKRLALDVKSYLAPPTPGTPGSPGAQWLTAPLSHEPI